MTSICFRVTGRVQGVGYRAWTVRTALKLGLRGWVRNVQDGAVEGVALGSAVAVDALLEAMKHGSMHAVVAKVTSKQVNAEIVDGFAARPTVADTLFAT
jgi:acylphosphatase